MKVWPQYPYLSKDSIQSNIESFYPLKAKKEQLKDYIEKVAKMGHRFVCYEVTVNQMLKIDTECAGGMIGKAAKKNCGHSGCVSININDGDFKIKSIDLSHEHKTCGIYTYRERCNPTYQIM